MSEMIHPEGKVFALNISEKKRTKKVTVPEVVVNARGFLNDAHAGVWLRQVSMLDKEIIDAFVKKHNKNIGAGAFAENITSQGLDLSGVKLLDRFIVGETELEVTRLGKECHGAECSIFKETGDCVMPKEGIFLRVKKTGKIKADDTIIHFPRMFRFKVITMSDKAAAGEFKDTSGPGIVEILGKFFQGKRNINIEYKVLPDEKEELVMELKSLTNAGSDAVIITGGTGIGPRDITPEVVTSICDRLIPGIMEYTRLKYGETNPKALLSRSVAGVMRRTLIYALPGSPKAVKEYMDEILKSLEHTIYMVHGLGH